MPNENEAGNGENKDNSNEVLSSLAEGLASITQNLASIGERLTTIEKGRMTSSEAAANALSYAAPVSITEDDVIEEFKTAAFKRHDIKESA